jgi:K+-transporting ATPase ATPase C chain
MTSQIKPAILMLLFFTLLTGVAYPLLVTFTAQLVFPKQANGSLLGDAGKPLGSALIGQPFSQPQYFWGRPSATSPTAYNAGSSGGSNQGPNNPALIEAVRARIEILRKADPTNAQAIPVELIAASASGLDPQLSPAAAEYQLDRIAKARRLPVQTLKDLLAKHTEARTWGILGEQRVNVLKLNLALDQLQ